MAKNVTARQGEEWLVVSLYPDVCKTPVGSSLPPVPYPVIARLKDAVQIVPSVHANCDPLVVFNQSKVPQTLGDEPGKGKGIKSKTVGAVCYPKDHSFTVRADGKFILRHDDEFWMNGA
ncbi:DUF4150 domain-containing protein [Pseudomonas mangiferae]|uniref:DUF4150 domain-containing protein n=1 Tax=Pseudomonas mangiferae TaxID=2593654 RepID=A0A553GTJ9_9PSED|nr:DUF4150 domain-containing protein [Pseudomonas mangiferae]TRX72845.1 DUF4150 domain-containing protein [Pseudomonas mangiferae]